MKDFDRSLVLTVERFLIRPILEHGAAAVRDPFKTLFQDEVRVDPPHWEYNRSVICPFIPYLGEIRRPWRLPFDHADFRDFHGDSIGGDYRRNPRASHRHDPGGFEDLTFRRDLDVLGRTELRNYWARQPGGQLLQLTWSDYLPYEITVKHRVNATSSAFRQVPSQLLPQAQSDIVAEEARLSHELESLRNMSRSRLLEWLPERKARGAVEHETAETQDQDESRSWRETYDERRALEQAVFLSDPKLRVHIYPFGLLQVWVSGHLFCRRDWGRDDHGIRAAESFSGLGAPATRAQLQMARFSGVGPDFRRQIAWHVVNTLLECPTRRDLTGGGTTSTLAGAATLGADRWLRGSDADDDRALPDRTRSEVRILGIRRKDHISATRVRTAIRVENEYRSTTRLAWNLALVRELAEAQRFFIAHLEGWANDIGGAERATVRLAQVLSTLTTFHLGFPAHHRKWLYKCQETLQSTDFPDRAAKLCDRLQHRISSLPGEPPAPFERVHIQVSKGSVLGAVNLGLALGNIEANLNYPSDEAMLPVRRGIAELTRAVHDSDVLGVAEKEALLEDLEALSDLEPSHFASHCLARLEEVLATVDTADAWSASERSLKALFGSSESTRFD